MGSKEVATTPQDIIKYLNDLCPIALSLGMSLEDYWHGEPACINYYVKAEEIRARKKNSELHLQGAYIYHALASVSPMFNSLAKSHKPQPYLREPFALSKGEEEERKYNRFLNQMHSLVGKKPAGR